MPGGALAHGSAKTAAGKGSKGQDMMDIPSNRNKLKDSVNSNKNNTG